MSISNALFTLLIGPLMTLFEIIYTIAYELTQNPGLAIIGLSLVMNLLLLPLYNQTDAIQLEAIETEKRLKPFISHIKKTFKGNEQFMMIQTCYRQNHYKPTDALKGISPLLLEIPFFMAAYNYLSGLKLLNGASFGPISNLGAPDGLLVIGGVAINVLPILMTLINILSSLIYTKDAPLKTKIQLYGMAALFLILLYDSPAGLAFYWTLNNLFSLIKNVFIKMKNPKFMVSIVSSLLSAGMMVYFGFIHPMDALYRQIMLMVLLVIMQLPLILYFIFKNRKRTAEVKLTSGDKFTFFLGCTFLTLLIGVLIPSAVIKASPAEFVDLTKANPLLYVLNTFLMAAGLFLVWLSVFYVLATPSGKRTMTLVVWLLSGVMLVDYMFFGTDYGTLSPNLSYLMTPAFGRDLLNLGLIVVVIGVSYLVWKKKPNLIRFVSGTLSLAILAMCAVNINGIQKGYRETLTAMNSSSEDGKSGILPLSKNGKNVIVLMLDRAISSYIPYIMNEKPELAEQFAGFTYYPNTISFGGFTNVGTPPLYAGYEYTPENMNKRSDEPLVEKHNEALKVMPVLFDQNDYQVTVCDPSYAGYTWVPDLAIYDDYPDIHAYHTIGHYNELPSEQNIARSRERLNRNFFYYSLFRVSPVLMQPIVYDEGNYNAFTPTYIGDEVVDEETFASYLGNQQREGLTKATGMEELFIRSYNVLEHLSELTQINNSSENTFLMMSNDAPHEPMFLQEPDYTPVPFVDNTEYDATHKDRFVLDGIEMKMENEQQIAHYHVNMATLLKLGQWFDYLRENGVYDNTRIILVSDHGRDLKQFDNMILGDSPYQDAMYFNPLLMVKDFGSTEFTVDNTFMTNADVPTIATNAVIENPVNPFTGNPINSDAKAGEQHILLTVWDTAVNNGNTFMDGQWFGVHSNVQDKNNWREISSKEMVS